MYPRHVYVHVPFCARRCTYCDFSIAVRSTVPVAEYVAALTTELSLRYPPTHPWPVDTLYLGGGTPSALGPDGVPRLFDALRQHLSVASTAEVTLEANPEHVTPAAITAWRTAGVTRLSLGAQSFDDRALTWMHRTHTAGQIAHAVHTAHDGGIHNVSLDLIFALPATLDRDWPRDVDHALELAPTHVSLYGLTVEPTTPLARWIDRGQVIAPTDFRYAREFLHAHAAMTAAGYDHYEVSNFARPGARSRHNSSYWTGAPYAGLGPAAHEFDGTHRRWNVAPYAAWHRALCAGADPKAGDECLTDANRVTEAVYLGLRTAEGLCTDPRDDEVVAPWLAHGWARRDGPRLTLTPSGWLRLDTLAADLTYDRSRS